MLLGCLSYYYFECLWQIALYAVRSYGFHSVYVEAFAWRESAEHVALAFGEFGAGRFLWYGVAHIVEECCLKA